MSIKLLFSRVLPPFEVIDTLEIVDKVSDPVFKSVIVEIPAAKVWVVLPLKVKVKLSPFAVSILIDWIL